MTRPARRGASAPRPGAGGAAPLRSRPPNARSPPGGPGSGAPRSRRRPRRRGRRCEGRTRRPRRRCPGAPGTTRGVVRAPALPALGARGRRRARGGRARLDRAGVEQHEVVGVEPLDAAGQPRGQAGAHLEELEAAVVLEQPPAAAEDLGHQPGVTDPHPGLGARCGRRALEPRADRRRPGEQDEDGEAHQPAPGREPGDSSTPGVRLRLRLTHPATPHSYCQGPTRPGVRFRGGERGVWAAGPA
jgi:hypothetical protein